MKILIAVCSDNKHRSQSDSQRATWMKLDTRSDDQVDYKIFFGRNGGFEPAPDEVILDVDDRYESITFKTHAIIEYAFEHDYDYVFHTDNDAYVRVDRLLASDFRNYDYVGFGCLSNTKPTLPGDEHQLYAHGGPGYWLSRAGMIAVLAQEPIENEGAQDWFVGRACQLGKVPLYADLRYVDLRVYPFSYDEASVIATAEHLGWQMWTEHRRYLGLRLLNEPPSKHIEKV